MSQPISVNPTALFDLNAALPTGFRTTYPDASGTHVVQIATTVIMAAKIAHNTQAKEIERLKEELGRLRGEVGKGKGVKREIYTEMKIDSSLLAIKTEAQSASLESLTHERADYHYNTMQLIMYITGEGAESRGPTIDYSKLRKVLEAAREGGWSIKKVSEGIEQILPADKEIIRKRKEMWEGMDGKRG